MGDFSLGNAYDEALVLAPLALRADVQSLEEVRSGIFISSAEAEQMRRVMPWIDVERLIEFRKSIAAHFDKMTATQLPAIRADAEKCAEGIEKGRADRAKRQRGYYKRWKLRWKKRKRARAAAQAGAL